MNVKQTAKKITAVVTGAALFTGLTVSGAAALDLSDYPEPFIMDGAFNGKLVVGEIASSQDIVGAIDIAASLQAQAKQPVGTGPVVGDIEGGELVERDFNDPFGFRLDYRHLEGFADTEITIDGTTYRYREHFDTDGTNWEVKTSSQTRDEDFGAEPFLTTPSAGTLKYYVEFRNNMLANAENGGSLDEDEGYTADIDLLGQGVEILNVEDGVVTLEGATTHTLRVGDSVEVEGRTVSLVNVGETRVIVDVDGESRPIADGRSERFRTADNFRVEVDGLFYAADSPDNMAILRMGDTLREDVRDGEPATLFGEVDDRNEASWVWHLEFADPGTDDELSRIGVRSNQAREDVEVRRARDRPALGIGDQFWLPNEYAGVEFSGILENQYALNIELIDDTDFIDEDDYLSEGPAVEFQIEGGDFFEVTGFDGDHTMEELSVIFVSDIQYADHPDGVTQSPGTANSHGLEIWYFDGDEEVLAAYNYNEEDENTGSISFELELDNDVVTVTLEYDNTGFDEYIKFDMNGVEDIWVAFDVENEHFGTDEDDALAADLVITEQGAGPDYGGQEYDILTTYGVTIMDPDRQFSSSSGSFEMWIPQNQQEAHVSVVSHGSAVRAAPTGDAYVVNPLGTGIAILDSEASVGSEPYIVVGGPRANTVAAQLLGNPSDEEINDMFGPGTAMIRLFADQNALLVAGWEAQDTVRASYVLAQYQDYDLTGTEVEVVTADVNNLQVRAPQ